MTSPFCEDAVAFLEGQLPPARADAYRLHLPDCGACQARLERAFHLHAMLATAYPAPRPAAAEPPPTSRHLERRATPRWAVRSRATLGAVLVPVAAALALMVLTPRTASSGPGSPGPWRDLDARLTYEPADGYRPHEEMRGADEPVRPVSPRQLEALQAQGDVRGLATVFLLANDLKQAELYFDKVPASAQKDADLAALALAKKDPQRALELCDAALKQEPRLAQALWNRALALRALGSFREAAAAFREVAALREPGWSDEAARRAEDEEGRWKDRQ